MTKKNVENPQIFKTNHTPLPDQTSVDIAKCQDHMNCKATTSVDKPKQIFIFANADIKMKLRHKNQVLKS